ncbi:AP2 domain transcription factor ap2viib-2 [Cyclospora cayetanensis]|uniref:AP2 domain transcription factor ap2viib-2 n=1 Tax=Cyclospora cayetanensis TaxID=88456 RepID=A0A1D3DB55_9EIME|nr:AP2 domain transcription factor ap2viib-2 [Cyclospora cayetanensis]
MPPFTAICFGPAPSLSRFLGSSFRHFCPPFRQQGVWPRSRIHAACPSGFLASSTRPRPLLSHPSPLTLSAASRVLSPFSPGRLLTSSASLPRPFCLRFRPVHAARPRKVSLPASYFDSPCFAVSFEALNEAWEVTFFENNKRSSKPFPVKKWGVFAAKKEAVAFADAMKVRSFFKRQRAAFRLLVIQAPYQVNKEEWRAGGHRVAGHVCSSLSLALLLAFAF